MAKSKVTVTELKKHLKQSSKEALINEIAELYKRFNGVKDFYQLKLSPEQASAVSDKYKRVIQDEFFPARGIGRARLSVAKKALSDYRKIGPEPGGMADLMLFYVEQGVQFTLAYGDIDEPFYNSMESVYDQTLNHLLKWEIKDSFQPRCHQVVQDTRGMGWGFHDALTEMYHEAFVKS